MEMEVEKRLKLQYAALDLAGRIRSLIIRHRPAGVQ